MTQTKDGYTCSEPDCWMFRHGGLPCAHLWCYLAAAEMQDSEAIHTFQTITDGKSAGGLFPDAVMCKTVLQAIGGCSIVLPSRSALQHHHIVFPECNTKNSPKKNRFANNLRHATCVLVC